MDLMGITTVREFWKHRAYADIYAVELMIEPEGGRTVMAARRCSRPEEQTHGALPVLTLKRYCDEAQFCTTNGADFDPWEPPTPPAEGVRRLIDAQNSRDEAEREYTRARADERAKLKVLEQATQTVMARARDLASLPPPTPPLIALSEAPDPATGDSGPSDDSPLLS